MLNKCRVKIADEEVIEEEVIEEVVEEEILDEDKIALRKAIHTDLMLLTGVVSDDDAYLTTLLLIDGTYFDKPVQVEVIADESTVDSFDDWFNNL